MFNITIITKSNCPACVKAKNLLLDRSLDYKELVIGTDITREEVIEKYPGHKTVPILLINDKAVGGLEKLVSLLIPN